MSALTDSPAWQALAAHRARMENVHMRDLFERDPERASRFSARLDGFLLDYSKNRITDETVKALLALAEKSGLRAKIDAMFAGEKINTTEGRAVLVPGSGGRRKGGRQALRRRLDQ